MAGRPGTPRVGEYRSSHESKPDASGESVLDLQNFEKFREQHFLYDPSQAARPSGTTLGGKPGDMAGYQKRMYEAPSNHDGFEGGDSHLVVLDERKVLENHIYSVRCEYADDEQRIWSSDERSA